MSLELPERYVLGTSPEVYAVYTVNGGDKQESTSARVPAVLTGLDALLEANVGRELDTASDVSLPGRRECSSSSRWSAPQLLPVPRCA